MNAAGGRHTEVWEGPDGLWRWRYVDPSAGEDGQPLELVGNKHYGSRALAMHTARTAYPDVGVHDRDGSAPSPPPRRRRRRLLWRAAWVAFLLWVLVFRRWRGTARGGSRDPRWELRHHHDEADLPQPGPDRT